MERLLRRLLVVCGVALMILGIAQFIQWGVYFTGGKIISGSVGFTQSLGYVLTSLLHTFEPLGFGALCLYAAHRLSPLKRPFRK